MMGNVDEALLVSLQKMALRTSTAGKVRGYRAPNMLRDNRFVDRLVFCYRSVVLTGLVQVKRIQDIFHDEVRLGRVFILDLFESINEGRDQVDSLLAVSKVAADTRADCIVAALVLRLPFIEAFEADAHLERFREVVRLSTLCLVHGLLMVADVAWVS